MRRINHFEPTEPAEPFRTESKGTTPEGLTLNLEPINFDLISKQSIIQTTKEGIIMAKRYYELHVAGCTRQLPIMNISDTLAIAGFVILGDTEIVTRTAEELAKKVPEGTDIILTAETKGIPLAHEMARVLGMKKYIVARKSVKAYMENPICVEDESITTMGKQRLYLSQDDVDLIRGRKVLLVDDVISTGGSMKAMKEITEKAGGRVIGEAAILAEGDAAQREDIIFLAPLPLFEAE